MKLYLSSYRVPTPDELFALLPKPIAECNLVIIPNAKDYKLPEERAQSIDEVTTDLQNLGFQVYIVDLRDYDDSNLLQQELSKYDVFWLAGGNTFVLRSELRRTGIDVYLRDLLGQNKVYCGESAGAIIAGTTLEGAEVGDDPGLADQMITEGLGLISKIIVPHADSVDFIEYINHMKKLHPDGSDVVYLNDDQALAVTT